MPIVNTIEALFSVNMLSAIASKGEMKFMTYSGEMNVPVVYDYLKRLIHSIITNLFLVLDIHPIHRSYRVKKFVRSTEGRLRLFHLPPDSPELDPDGLVWNNVKSKVRSLLIKALNHFQKKVLYYLKSLQRNTEKICAFCQEPNLRYSI